MHWILIVMLGQQSFTAEFNSQSACINAKNEIVQTIASRDADGDKRETANRIKLYSGGVICVPKGK